MSRIQIVAAIAFVMSAGFFVVTWSPAGEEAKRKPVFSNAKLEVATFAGGCFWCMEPPFEKLSGVFDVVSGYTGGLKKNPTYEEVSHSETGHVEAVSVTYDPTQITYDDLLNVFWRNIDPTDDGGQFVDRGSSYESAIFYHNESQRVSAERSKDSLAASGRFDKPIVTPIRAASAFYPAEEYHQDYYKKHALKYKYYRYRSGRDQFIESVWGDDRNYRPAPKQADDSADRRDVGTTAGMQRKDFYKPSDSEIRSLLTPLQYRVTQEEGTERPFANDFWDNTADGIYVDIVSGEPLFSSNDKYKSGTGWPSFTRPLIATNVVETIDRRLFGSRTEVRSKHGESHLGHVFKDGPAPTGLRYCLNSAALRFIPAKDLTRLGYDQFAPRFPRIDDNEA